MKAASGAACRQGAWHPGQHQRDAVARRHAQLARQLAAQHHTVGARQGSASRPPSCPRGQIRHLASASMSMPRDASAAALRTARRRCASSALRQHERAPAPSPPAGAATPAVARPVGMSATVHLDCCHATAEACGRAPPLEPVHHRQHDDQRRHAQRDAEHGTPAMKEMKPSSRPPRHRWPGSASPDLQLEGPLALQRSLQDYSQRNAWAG